MFCGWSGMGRLSELNGLLRRVVKKRVFYGQADHNSCPPLTVSFWWFFLCTFDLLLWLYVFWNKFYKRNSQFSCNFWNPQFLLLLLMPSVWSFARGRPLILTTKIRAWKMHFETPHNEIKCVLSVKESSTNEKKVKIFTFLRSAWL